MRWQELVDSVPRLGARCRERLLGPGVVLVVTTRRDGTPRLSPVEPYVFDGDLWLTMMWRSKKVADLARDPRFLVHSIVTRREGDEGDVKLYGRAVEVGEGPRLDAMAGAVARDLGWRPQPGRSHVFTVDITSVSVVRYHENGDQQVAIWPAGIEVLRRQSGDTSVGAAEPCVDLLAPTPSGHPRDTRPCED